MSAKLDIDILGSDRIIKRFDDMKRRVSNAAPFSRRVTSRIISRQLRSIFDQEGPGWQELSPYTVAVRQWPYLPILEQTGRLKREVIDQPVERFNRLSYIRGTINPYAWKHEHGYGRIPQRAFMGPALRRSAGEIRRAYRTWIFTGKMPKI